MSAAAITGSPGRFPRSQSQSVRESPDSESGTLEVLSWGPSAACPQAGDSLHLLIVNRECFTAVPLVSSLMGEPIG